MGEDLRSILKYIEEHPEHSELFLTATSKSLANFRARCEKRNNHLFREALGDACHMLGMKRRPKAKEMRNFCVRIKDAIFKDGITQFHHEGEKNFFNRYLKGEIE